METHHIDAHHGADGARRSLLITLIIVILVMAVEIAGGILSDSLALLGDAGHMFVDALALGISLWAMTIARRPATLTKTFGYFRAEILAALANGSTLVVVSLYIFYEAYQRFWAPPVVKTPLMLVVATIGLFANLAGVILLNRASHKNLNVRSAFLHIIGDTMSSVGVIIAGIIITFTGWYQADPIVAVVIGGIILWGAVRILMESVNILLEGVPGQIEINKVVETIRKIPGVNDIHDIHIWALASNVYALSAHLVIDDQRVSQCTTTMEAVKDSLAINFNINHTTVQLECGNCPSGLVCEISRQNANGTGV